ncbi:MAG: hypothetical protein LBR97_01185 [Dysgonamonadaceae bacterium]|jgi:hypothetical protein|nr:hypothetical protein [Dysgonamonadaceae bacterium]
MSTYQLQINDKIPLGKSILSLLKSATDVVTLLPVRKKAEEEKHSPLYYELQSAFRDVKLMVDGKKKEKTIEEFLAELPDEL